jgi:hypothetical protein
VKNDDVSLPGSDSNSGATPAGAWLTLQHANNVGRTAGDCVNVEPGTYAHGVKINTGGKLASKTGYVVWRCVKMDACIVTDVAAGNQQGAFSLDQSALPLGGRTMSRGVFQTAMVWERRRDQARGLA